MMFTKLIENITFEDVIEFCNAQISEGINLDYKKDFPKDLEKTISAFANTYGGLILIGVKEKDGKPIQPFEGIKYVEKTRERVNSVVIGNIYPPVFCEIQVCPPKDNRTFVVIRVPQSNLTPHAIFNRKHIYIRTDNITMLEDLTTIDQVEWLINRRQKSEEFRKLLIKTAKERFESLCYINKDEIAHTEATVTICPLYPDKSLISSRNFNGDFFNRLMARGYSMDEFPGDMHDARPIKSGVFHFLYKEINRYIESTEVNEYGLIYHKRDLGYTQKDKQGVIKKEFHFITIIGLIDLYLEFALNFYNEIGYRGLLEFTFSLDKLLEIEGVTIADTWRDKNKKQIDKNLEWKKYFSWADLTERRFNILCEFCEDIAWSLGWRDIDRTQIKNILTDNKRTTK